jgi:glycosyltransferase involved in cell wall biosynthesis
MSMGAASVDYIGGTDDAPPKTLWVTMLLENSPYPQDTRVRQEAESLVSAGHRVQVIAPRGPGQPLHEWLNGVEVRRFRSLSRFRRGAAAILLEYSIAAAALHMAALRALVRGSDVLHLNNPPDAFFCAGAMFRLAGRPVVFDHHDLVPELVSAKFRARALVRVSRVAERLTFAVASHVLAPNRSHAETAIERGGKRSSDVTIVRNGPCPSWTRRPVRIRPGRLDTVRVAYLGTVAAQDGVADLAEVLAIMRHRSPGVEVTLTVIGDGSGRARLEAELAKWRVADSVTITGWVPLEDVPGYIDEADICVDPAPATVLNERSTMIKVAEYLALGKPVVAYDLLETRRTVARAAILVKPGDKARFADEILSLAADPALRTAFAQRARERAKDLGWDKSERALLSAYAGLIAPERGRLPERQRWLSRA